MTNVNVIIKSYLSEYVAVKLFCFRIHMFNMLILLSFVFTKFVNTTSRFMHKLLAPRETLKKKNYLNFQLNIILTIRSRS